ncbi:hypothetical protein ACHAXR_009653 [Thalassiosira sp. AJA248-18]
MSSSNIIMYGEEDEEEVLSDLTESLTLMPQIIEKYETRFLRVEQSELYKPTGMVMPKLPMYHPYHPFKNNSNDDILQVPLAMILRNADLAPPPLVEYIKKNNIDVPTIFFIAQTLPYGSDTEVICRYQYALFPEAKGEMKGHQSIWAQSVVYEKDKLFARVPPTEIKIYESEKGKVVSPTILCGDSMKLGNVEILRGRGLWSLVLGSYTEPPGVSPVCPLTLSKWSQIGFCAVQFERECSVVPASV